jgi:hypothetical protein
MSMHFGAKEKAAARPPHFTDRAHSRRKKYLLFLRPHAMFPLAVFNRSFFMALVQNTPKRVILSASGEDARRILSLTCLAVDYGRTNSTGPG